MDLDPNREDKQGSCCIRLGSGIGTVWFGIWLGFPVGAWYLFFYS
jgi:hypothetical protein